MKLISCAIILLSGAGVLAGAYSVQDPSGSVPSTAAAVGAAAGNAKAAAAAATLSVDRVVATKFLPDGWGAGRLYDWSRAGYAGGERPIHSPSLVFNVMKKGATGRGRLFDDIPVQAALKAASESATGGVVYFPAGTYLLSRPLYVNVSNVVIRGAGATKTTLLFNQSLSDFYGGSWTLDPCTGAAKSLWAFSGGMITLSGTARRSIPPDVLANVVVGTKTLDPGANRLKVDDTTRFKAEQWVQLLLNDASTASNIAPNGSETVNCSLYGKSRAAAASDHRVRLLPITDTLRGDPIFQMALEAAAADTEGEGLTPAQAAAIDAKFASSGQVGPSMAEPGTIAAWVYGENKAESGGPGAIDTNTVRFVFRVSAVGPDYVELDRDLIHAIKPSWTAQLTEYNPGIENSGVEQISIKFKSSGKYEGHLTDRGYNAIQLNSLANCWVRGVKIVDADNGVFASKADFTTIKNVIIKTGDRSVSGDTRNGHHAISVSNGQSNLVTRAELLVKYWHDITVDQAAYLTVYSNVEGVDMNLDNHRAGVWANLFTDVSLGKGSRPFGTSGRGDRGANAGRGTTFWNLRPDEAVAVKLPSCNIDTGAYLNFVLKKQQGDKCSGLKWKVATLTSSMPANLYDAQVAERKAELDRRKRRAAPVQGASLMHA